MKPHHVHLTFIKMEPQMAGIEFSLYYVHPDMAFCLFSVTLVMFVFRFVFCDLLDQALLFGNVHASCNHHSTRFYKAAS